jgi:hypothetical protein
MNLRLFLLIAILACQSCVTTNTKLTVVRGPQAWAGYPQSVDHPSSTWENGTLRVRVVVNEIGGLSVEDSPSVSVHGHDLVLCYRYQEISRQQSSTTYYLPEPVMPVLLDFSISKLPHRNYHITTSRNCAGLG